MPRRTRPLIALAALALAVSGCGSSAPTAAATRAATTLVRQPTPSRAATTVPAPATTAHPSGEFTLALAGDVHFMERTRTLLDADPATAFGPVAAVLSKADLTMVNLETAITERGIKAPKSYNFRASATAFTALRSAGIDLVTMANNHAADYSEQGLQDTLEAIRTSRFPVVGIGQDAEHAYAPWRATINGVHLAVIAASQVRDETLANYTATDSSPGIANAYSPRLVAAVRAARAAGDTVVVYLHWGTEYTQCPNADQVALAATLARAGATAVVGTHAHVLQGAGWRPDGVYVAYGLSNYYWWRNFGNAQDDAGVLTLTIRADRVMAADFDPAHLEPDGIAPPARGLQRARIAAEWDQVRGCAGLAARPS